MQNSQQSIRPGRIVREAVRGLSQHLLDLAMLRTKRRDVIGECLTHLGKQALFLHHGVRSENDQDLPAVLGDIPMALIT